MIVRPMTEQDLDEVVEIENAAFSQPWTKQGFLDTLRNKDTLYLVAEENGEILGYLGLWQSFEEADITNVAVKSTARRKGVGTALLEKIIKQAEVRGITVLTLEVRKSNEVAIRLYEKQGFQPVGIRPGFYNMPREDAVMMKKITIVNPNRTSV